ncbi:Two-component system sensor histidine kinase [Streptomyces sp. PVA_94-07]|uniref:sensor histidine kinase n=1 Tax=Streptomyces sp. PVA_94-07 TaxID=1225337 RepID=UPI0003C2FA39|nr:histidine kinase [Streptomyces sp. PVA_94-07]ESQ04639.1 Two-component system sensor histidine kinase [Streptomyces sp. PVA_94-07]
MTGEGTPGSGYGTGAGGDEPAGGGHKPAGGGAGPAGSGHGPVGSGRERAVNGHGATGTGDGPADSGRERTRNGHGPTSSRHEPPGTAPGGAPRSPRPRPRLARTSEGTRTETGRATPPSRLTPPGRTARHLPPTSPTLYAGHTTHPGPTASALADDVPAPSPRVQLNALQALCRQVFGVRLALIALGAPFALQNAADGAARYLVLTAAVTGFMASYAMLRDWERFGPLVLRHPALLGLDLLIGAVLLLTASPASPLGYAAACTPLLAGLLYGWRGAGVLTGCQLVVLLVAHRAWADALTSGASTLLVAGFCVAAGITGVTLRNLMFRFGAATTALAEANARLAVAGAVEAERARLARDLHDSLAKTLHGLALTADSLAEGTGHLPPDTLRDRAVQVADAARRAAADSRDLLSGLRHDAADPTGPVDLAETLRTGLPSGTPLDAAGPLPPVPHAVAQHLLAIAAEAVENAHRHATSPPRTALTTTGTALRLTVTDHGPGLPAGLTLQSASATGHFGLVGMAERATAIGGALRVGPAGQTATGPGTEVRIELPLAVLETAPPPGTCGSAPGEHLSGQNPPARPPD